MLFELIIGKIDVRQERRDLSGQLFRRCRENATMTKIHRATWKEEKQLVSIARSPVVYPRDRTCTRPPPERSGRQQLQTTRSSMKKNVVTSSYRSPKCEFRIRNTRRNCLQQRDKDSSRHFRPLEC